MLPPMLLNTCSISALSFFALRFVNSFFFLNRSTVTKLRSVLEKDYCWTMSCNTDISTNQSFTVEELRILKNGSCAPWRSLSFTIPMLRGSASSSLCNTSAVGMPPTLLYWKYKIDACFCCCVFGCPRGINNQVVLACCAKLCFPPDVGIALGK